MQAGGQWKEGDSLRIYVIIFNEFYLTFYKWEISYKKGHFVISLEESVSSDDKELTLLQGSD